MDKRPAGSVQMLLLLGLLVWGIITQDSTLVTVATVGIITVSAIASIISRMAFAAAIFIIQEIRRG